MISIWDQIPSEKIRTQSIENMKKLGHILAEFCHTIDKKGGFFMLSNSNTALVRKLYNHYNAEKVLAPRFVNCKADGRNKQYELIIRNYQ